MGISATKAVHNRIELLQRRDVSRYQRLIRIVASCAIFSSPLWLGALFFTSTGDSSIAISLICVLLFAIVGAIAVMHLTQNDIFLRQLMMASLPAHMAASSLFLWIGYVVYGGTADTFHYWTVGLYMAEKFQVVGWSVFQPPYWSTNLINNLCGLAVLVAGDALPAFFIAFCLIAFAGGYLFYRAFILSFPEGDRWLFGIIIMLSPSLLFWSSFVGKDAPIQLAIALACLGYARLVLKPSPTSLLLCATGLMGTLLIRAHVAAMLAIAMTFPYAVGKWKKGRNTRIARILLIPALLSGTYFLISQAKDFIDVQSDNSTGVVQQANDITKNSQIGGSSFNERTSFPVRVAESPFLPFRPFPWEMRSITAIPAAGESVCLMLLCWYRRREIWSTLRNWRDPFIGFLMSYTVIFIVTFGGAISNFGIILRQRIMMMPVLFMLICAQQKFAKQPDGSRLKRARWSERTIRIPREA